MGNVIRSVGGISCADKLKSIFDQLTQLQQAEDYVGIDKSFKTCVAINGTADIFVLWASLTSNILNIVQDEG